MTPKELVAEFISRCDTAASGSAADPYALLADDVNVTLPGKTAISGSYPNKEIVQKVLVGVVAERMRKANVTLVDMIAQDGRVATKLDIRGESIDGKIYNPKGEPSGCVFGISGDRIEEVILFPDNTMVETVVSAREYVPNGGAAANA